MYNLPQTEIRAPTPPRFGRDNLHIDDIEGARSKKLFKGSNEPREVNKLDDIQGTRSTIRHKGRDRSNSFTQMCYRDVTVD